MFKKVHKLYYKKILFMMCMFIVVVIMPFVTLLYCSTQNNMLNNINRSNEHVLNQMKFNYTYFSENIAAICLSTFFRYDVNATMYNNTVDYNQVYGTIKNLKDNILQSQPSLQSIQIYNAQCQEWYSTDADAAVKGAELEQYLKGRESIPKLLPILRKVEGNYEHVDTSQYVFSYFMYEYADPTTGNDSFIVVNQNASWFIDNLIGAVMQDIPASLYLVGESGEIFGYKKENISLDEEKLIQDHVRRYNNEEDGIRKQGYYLQEYKGEKVLISYVDLEDRGNCIVMIQEYKKIFSNLIQLKNDFLGICLLFSAIGLVMLVYLSIQIYRPVDDLVDYISEIEGDDSEQMDESEEDEIKHLRMIYEKTNATKKALLLEKQSTRGSLKQFLLANLLEESTDENWNKYAKNVPESVLVRKKEHHLMVVLLKIDYSSVNRYDFVEEDSLLLLSSVANVIIELLPEYTLEPVKKDVDCLAVIIDRNEFLLDIGRIRDRVKHMQEFFKSKFDISISASLSSTTSCPEELSQLYEETKKYLQYRLVYGPLVLLDEEICLKNIQNHQHTYSRELRRRLRESLKLGNMEQIKEILKKIQEELSELSYENIIISMMSLVTEINNVMNEVNMARNIPIQIHFNKIYKRVIEVDFIDQVFQELVDYISDILLDTYQKKENKNDKEEICVRMVKEYINQNYMDIKLSSQSIADYMHMSGRHVMKKFKQCMGIALNEYILDIRMKRAAELLINTKLPVNKIAENIGIENENYFYRLFKKVYGCTPREFSNKKQL